jgi:hypothetical protein
VIGIALYPLWNKLLKQGKKFKQKVDNDQWADL